MNSQTRKKQQTRSHDKKTNNALRIRSAPRRRLSTKSPRTKALPVNSEQPNLPLVPKQPLALPSARTYTRLLVLDAFSILFRSHFALARSHLRRGVDGRVVSGLSGFTNTLLKITKEVKPTHIAVCMDTPATIGFRRKLYAGYKKDRGGRDDDLVWQIQQLPYVVQALGIPTLFVPGFEADDVLASVCHKVKEEKEQLKEMFLNQYEGDSDAKTKIQTENKFFDDGYGVFGSNLLNKYHDRSKTNMDNALVEFEDKNQIHSSQNSPSQFNSIDSSDESSSTLDSNSRTKRTKVGIQTDPITGDQEEVLVKKSHQELMWQKDFHFTKIRSITPPKKETTKKSTATSAEKEKKAKVAEEVPLVELDTIKLTLKSLQNACIAEYYAVNPPPFKSKTTTSRNTTQKAKTPSIFSDELTQLIHLAQKSRPTTTQTPLTRPNPTHSHSHSHSMNNPQSQTVVPTDLQQIDSLMTEPFFENLTAPQRIKFGSRQNDFAASTPHPILHSSPQSELGQRLRAKLTGEPEPPTLTELLKEHQDQNDQNDQNGQNGPNLNSFAPSFQERSRLVDYPIEFSPVASHAVGHTAMLIQSIRAITDRPITYDIETVKSLSKFEDTGNASYQDNYSLDLEAEVKKSLGTTRATKKHALTPSTVDSLIQPHTQGIGDELNDGEEVYDPNERLLGLEESVKTVNVLLLYQKGYIPRNLVKHYFQWQSLLKTLHNSSDSSENLQLLDFNPDEVKPESLQILDQLLEEISLSQYSGAKMVKKAVTAEKLTKQLHKFLSTTLPSAPSSSTSAKSLGEKPAPVKAKKTATKTKATKAPKATTTKTPKAKKEKVQDDAFGLEGLEDLDFSTPSMADDLSEFSGADLEYTADLLDEEDPLPPPSPKTRAKRGSKKATAAADDDLIDPDDEQSGETSPKVKKTRRSKASPTSVPLTVSDVELESIPDFALDDAEAETEAELVQVVEDPVPAVPEKPKRGRKPAADKKTPKAPAEKKTTTVTKATSVSKADAFRAAFNLRAGTSGTSGTSGSEETSGDLDFSTPFDDHRVKERHERESREQGIFGLDVDMFPPVDSHDWATPVTPKTASKSSTKAPAKPKSKRATKSKTKAAVSDFDSDDFNPPMDTVSTTAHSKMAPADYDDQGPPADAPVKKTRKTKTPSVTKTPETTITPGVGTTLIDPFSIKKRVMAEKLERLVQLQKAQQKKREEDAKKQESTLQNLFVEAEHTFDIIGHEFDKFSLPSYDDFARDNNLPTLDELSVQSAQKDKAEAKKKRDEKKLKKLKEKEIVLGLPNSDLIEVQNPDGTVTLAPRAVGGDFDGMGDEPDIFVGQFEETTTTKPKRAKKSKSPLSNSDAFDVAGASSSADLHHLPDHIYPEPVSTKATKSRKKQAPVDEEKAEDNFDHFDQFATTAGRQNIETDHDQHTDAHELVAKPSPSSRRTKVVNSAGSDGESLDEFDMPVDGGGTFAAGGLGVFESPWTKPRSEIDHTMIETNGIYSKARTQLVHQQFAIAYEQQHKEQRQDVMNLVKKMQELQMEKTKRKHLTQHNDPSAMSRAELDALSSLELGHVLGHDPATFATQIDDDNVWFGPTHHHALRSLLQRPLKNLPKDPKTGKDNAKAIPNHASSIPLDAIKAAMTDDSTAGAGKKKKTKNAEQRDHFGQFDHLDKHQLHYTGSIEQREGGSEGGSEGGEGGDEVKPQSVDFDDISKQFDQARTEIHPSSIPPKTHDSSESAPEHAIRPTSYGIDPNELYRSYEEDFQSSLADALPDASPSLISPSSSSKPQSILNHNSSPQPTPVHPIQAFTSYYVPFPTDNNGIYAPYYSSISTPTFYDNLYYLSREYNSDLYRSKPEPTHTVVNNHYTYKVHQLDKVLNNSINHKTGADPNDPSSRSHLDSSDKSATSLGAPTPLPVTMHKYSHIVSSRLPLSYPLTLEDDGGTVYDTQTRKALYDVHATIFTKPQQFRLPPTLQEILDKEREEKDPFGVGMDANGKVSGTNQNQNDSVSAAAASDPSSSTHFTSLLENSAAQLDGIASDTPPPAPTNAIDSLTNDVSDVASKYFKNTPTRYQNHNQKGKNFNNHLTSTIPSPIPFYQTVRWPKLYPSIALPPQLLPLRLNSNLTLTTQYKRHIIENISQRDIVRFGLYSMSPYSNYDQRSVYFNDFVPRLATHIHRDMTTKWDAHSHTPIKEDTDDNLLDDRYFDESLARAQDEQISALNSVEQKANKSKNVIDDFDALQAVMRDMDGLSPTVKKVPLASVYGIDVDADVDAATKPATISTLTTPTQIGGLPVPAVVKTTLPSTQAPTQPPVGTISVHAHDVPILPSLWYSSSQYHTASDHYIGPKRGWWNKFESLDTSQGGVDSTNVSDAWGYGFYAKKNASANQTDSKKPSKKKIKLGSEFDYSLAAMTDGTTGATSCASENAYEYDDNGPPIRGDEFQTKVEGGSLMNALLPEGINVTRGKHANQTNIGGDIMDIDQALARVSEGELSGEVIGTQGKDLLDHEINNLFIEGMKATYTPYYGTHVHNQTSHDLVKDYLEKRGSLPSLLKQARADAGAGADAGAAGTKTKPLFDIMNHAPTPITPTPAGFKLEQPEAVSEYDRALFKYLAESRHVGGDGHGHLHGQDQQPAQEQKEYDILTSTLPPHLTSWLPHVDQVFVVSGDKDVEQVISPHVTLIKHNGSAGLKHAMTKYKKKRGHDTKKNTLTIGSKDFFIDGNLDEFPFAAVSVSQHTHNDPLAQLKGVATTSLDGDLDQAQVDVAASFDWIATPAKPVFALAEPFDNAIYDLSEKGSSFPLDLDDQQPGKDTKGKKGKGATETEADLDKTNTKESLLGPNTASSHSSLYNTDRSKWNMHVNPTSAHAYHTAGAVEGEGSGNGSDWQNGTSYTIQNYESSLQKYGFCPTQLPQLQALMGDTSDNIPGIKGIGPTMASKLISQFGDINNVIQIAALYLGYDSTQTQVLIDRTFTRSQYQKANGIETTLGDNHTNILFSPLDCRGYQPIPGLDQTKSGPSVRVDADGNIDVDTNPDFQPLPTAAARGDSLSIPSNNKTMKRLSKKQALLDMAQRQQMALSLDWPLSTKLTHQLLNNLDALFISLSLVTMRQDLKIPSPKHTLYIGTDKKHMSKVFNQYNMFAMSDEMRTLFDSNEQSVLKGAYNGEYGELLLDAGLYLHQVRQKMGISPNDLETKGTDKEGFLSYQSNLPQVPNTHRYPTGTGTRSQRSDDNDYYQLHYHRAKRQMDLGKVGKGKDKGQNDIVLTDYNRPKYAFDPNLVKIGDNKFYRPTYATYGMGSVDGKYYTSFDPYGGIVNVHQKIFPNRKYLHDETATSPYRSPRKTPSPSPIPTGPGSFSKLDLGLEEQMEAAYIKAQNKDVTRYIQDRNGNTVLFLPYDVHRSFVFNLDENHADHVRGMAQQIQQQGHGVRPIPSLDSSPEFQSHSEPNQDQNQDQPQDQDQDDPHSHSYTLPSSSFQPTKPPRQSHGGFKLFAKTFGLEDEATNPNTASLNSDAFSTIFGTSTATPSPQSFHDGFSTTSRRPGSRLNWDNLPTHRNFSTKANKAEPAAAKTATESTPIEEDSSTKKTRKKPITIKSKKSSKKSDEIDELGGLMPPLPAIFSLDGERFNLFLDIDQEQENVLPEAGLPIEHYHGIIPALADTEEGLDLDSFNLANGLDAGSKSTSKKAPISTTIYKDHESTQDSIVNISKKRTTTPATTKSAATTKKKGQTQTGIVIDSVAPSSLVQLPLSVVVHGILSNIDAGVDISRGTSTQKNVDSQFTNPKHPGCTVVRGLFSTIVIGQEKPSPAHSQAPK